MEILISDKVGKYCINHSFVALNSEFLLSQLKTTKSMRHPLVGSEGVVSFHFTQTNRFFIY